LAGQVVTEWSGNIDMVAGKPYDIELYYIQYLVIISSILTSLFVLPPACLSFPLALSLHPLPASLSFLCFFAFQKIGMISGSRYPTLLCFT
jgi:hypothetical protein